MSNNTKEYKIVINGLQESVDVVKSLNEQLSTLEQRIKAVENKTVKVDGGVSRSAASSLSEQDKLQREILATEQKLEKVRDENYKKLLHMKEELKEYTQIAKSQVASEANHQGLYDTNTMAGIKGQLKSIKTEMQTLDIDSNRFKILVSQANELNSKLKEIEQSYGQYGRNVGNYANSITEGLGKLNIDVGGIAEEFDNAKQALVSLKKEMQTLSVKKDLGIISDEESERLKSLIPTVKQLESSVKDAGKPMDALLDSMQSIVAIASTAEGFASMFGFDDTAIEETIKKLVSLQNVLQGLQTIQNQMKAQEGIGMLLTKGNKAIDNMVKSIVGVGTAAKGATVATKALSVALKGLGIGLAIAAVTTLVNVIDSFIEKQKKAAEEEKKSQEVARQSALAYKMAKQEMSTYSSVINSFNGTKTEERKLVNELNSKYGTALGTYKTLAQWKDVLNEKTEAYCKSLALEAELMAATKKLEEAYIAQMDAAKYKPSFWERILEGESAVKTRIKAVADENVKAAEDAQAEIVRKIQENNKKNKLFDFSPQIKDGANKTKKSVVDAEEMIAKARVDAMKQGLTKTLAQLELERNKRIAEAKKTGKLVQEQIELINKTYENKMFEARVEYHVNLLNSEREYNEKLAKLQEDMFDKEVEISRKRNEMLLDENKRSAVDFNNMFELNALTIDYNSSDVRKYLGEYNKDVVKAYINTKNTVEFLQKALDNIEASYETIPDEARKLVTKYSAILDESKKQLREIEEENEGISEIVGKYIGIVSEKMSEAYVLRKNWRSDYYKTILEYTKNAADKELEIEREKIEEEHRMEEESEKNRHRLASSMYYDDGIGQNERLRFNTPRAALEAYIGEDEKGSLLGKTKEEIGTYFSEYRKEMDKWIAGLKNGVQEGKYTWEEYNEFMNQEIIQGYLKALDEFNNITLSEQAASEEDAREWEQNLNNEFVEYLENIRSEQTLHNNKMKVIENEYNANIRQAEIESLNARHDAMAEYNSNLIGEIENVLSSISYKIDKSESKNAWGIINYKATKDSLKDLDKTIGQVLEDIAYRKEELLEDLKNGEISFGDYDTLISQLKTIETQTQETGNNVQNKLKNLTGEWWGSIDQWIQAVGQTMNQILSSLSEIQGNKYETLIAQQDKYIEEYESRLDKQRELTQQYADAVESIEDELSTARGDRRQQLIDMLNAEMAAQRASLEQEKKIEREREKAEEKKKKLEHDQAVAKKKMQLAQAAINMAMAISMAAVNNWPIPAIPMMALASAAGAAQIAAIQSQNIPSYGSGGVIQGKSHREGGVKAVVGNSPIELEGNEFIIRKKSTIPNLNLLNFVNRSEKKLSLDDLINFYTNENGMRKKVISNSPKTKYADGGQIPTLRTDISLSNRLLTAFEEYSNRPTVVQVVDILDRTQAVNEVRVLAGIE